MHQPVLLVVACDADHADELAAILWSHSPSAVAVRSTDDGPTLAAGFERAQIPLVVDDLDHRFTFEIVEPDDDWLDAWRAHAQAWTAGRRFLVAPPWIEVAAPAERDLVLRIDPGRAFGNGAHPTTQLALAALEETVRPGDRLLDVGCGSGILSVAAAMLGAGAVTAVDIDPAAGDATTANAASHGAEIDVRVGSLAVLDAGSTYEVVVANMLAADLAPMLVDLADRVASGGCLVLSGLLHAQADSLTRQLPMVGVERWRLDEWTAVALRRD